MGGREGGGRVVQLLLSILLGGKNYAWRRDMQCVPLPFCIKHDNMVTVDNLIIRIDCPPLNNE